MEAAGGYVKEIWLASGWAMGWQVKTIVLYTGGCLLSLSMCRRGFQDLLKVRPYLFHIPARGLHVGRYPFTTGFVKGTHPTPSPSIQLA
jgi:hypothetical protein